MKFTSLSLSNYLGISPEYPFKCADLGHINILIGANNSGKSILTRFLRNLRIHGLSQGGHQFVNNPQASDIFNPSAWFKSVQDQPISAQFELNVGKLAGSHPFTPSAQSGQRDTFGKKGAVFVNGETFTVNIEIFKHGTEQALIQYQPIIYFEGKRERIVQCINLQHKYLSPRGHYSDQPEDDAKDFVGYANACIHRIITRIRYFDTVRSLYRSGSDMVSDDGSRLISTMYEMSTANSSAIKWGAFRELFLERINALFIPSRIGCVYDVHVTKDLNGKNPQLFLYFTNNRSLPVNVQHMGSGISELLIVLAAHIEDKDENMIYIIEEPETHMHPELQRRFMDFISTQQHNQYILTTHSSTFLDRLSTDDRLLNCKMENDKCIIKDAKTYIEKQNTLDELGIAGSSLLQANCVIWVEGPSDRLYIRSFLKALSRDGSLREGIDYNFVFYGGALLSQYTMEDPSAGDFVELLSICRYSAVIMDRDVGEVDYPKKLAARKIRILEEAKKDPKHRFAHTTVGFEIENDVPNRIWCRFLETEISIDVATLSIIKDIPFPNSILKSIGKEADLAICNKLESNKLAIAHKLSAEISSCAVDEIPDYLKDLLRFIIASKPK